MPLIAIRSPAHLGSLGSSAASCPVPGHHQGSAPAPPAPPSTVCAQRHTPSLPFSRCPCHPLHQPHITSATPRRPPPARPLLCGAGSPRSAPGGATGRPGSPPALPLLPAASLPAGPRGPSGPRARSPQRLGAAQGSGGGRGAPPQPRPRRPHPASRTSPAPRAPPS